MLSHSSIVAREYGIPCVVSVPGCLGLPDGAIVHVDGYGGVVTVEATPAVDAATTLASAPVSGH